MKLKIRKNLTTVKFKSKFTGSYQKMYKLQFVTKI